MGNRPGRFWNAKAFGVMGSLNAKLRLGGVFIRRSLTHNVAQEILRESALLTVSKQPGYHRWTVEQVAQVLKQVSKQ